MFRFGLVRPGQNVTLFLKSTGGSPQADWSPCKSSFGNDCIVKKSSLYTIKKTSQQRMEMVSHLLILLFLLFMPFLPRTVHHFSGNGRERELHWRDHTRDGAQMTWQAELPEYIYHWRRCHSCMWNVGQELGIADARRTGWPSSFFLSTACFNFK